MPTRPPKHVVLVGAGHAHIHVLERCIRRGPPEARLTLIVDRRIAIYSGMIPGYVAGRYRPEELQIDAVALAERAGADVILSRAVGLDSAGRRILIEDGPPVSYDIASLDIGSTVLGLDLPGIRQHAIPTRPIAGFMNEVEGLVVEAGVDGGADPFGVVVVGGGPAGVELAFALEARLRSLRARPANVTLLELGPRIVSRYPASLVRRVMRCARARDIEIRCNEEVVGAEEGVVRLRGGERLPCRALIWVTGPTHHPDFSAPGMATDDRGFFLVRPTLQVRDHEDLFAVGDCATFIDYPDTPKAGVYAVREGPIITENLYAAVSGRSLTRYRPQGDFLTLLNLGDGRALGAKWGISFEGRWVMSWKDRIDRRFMDRFQALASMDARGPGTEEE